MEKIKKKNPPPPSLFLLTFLSYYIKLAGVESGKKGNYLVLDEEEI